VLVETNELGIVYLSKKRYDRLELIYRLNQQHYSNREISDYLNGRNLKTVRTNDVPSSDTGNHPVGSVSLP
jgi:hypothetical protein